jgi:peptidoglycan-N-acetylglucosamine deacetylase
VKACAVNALTVDLEDWYHVCGLPYEPQVPAAEWRVQDTMEKLLTLLADHGVQATFFVLGSVAEALPQLVPRIAASGHEIASHGYSHRLVGSLSPAQFREEIRRTEEILGVQSGRKPAGFRAPQWSLSAGMNWAFDILREEGYCYDSSCTPLALIGNPDAPRVPYRIPAAGGTLWEIPPLVTPTWFGNWPTGGGWGFRFFPRIMIERTIRELNRRGMPAVLFVHPREFEPGGPRLPLSPLKSFATYGPRRDVTPRLAYLLRRHRFGTLGSLVEQWASA